MALCRNGVAGEERKLNKGIVIATAAGLAVAAAAALFLGRSGAAAAYIDPSDAALVSRGKPVYAQHCAACHGASMEGQPNWRERRPDGRLPAPPHDASGHTWHHPDAVLVDIVKHGLVPGKTAPDAYQSDMPAFERLLSDADVLAVLAYIKSGWPAQEREAQKEVTLQRH
ncbi:c-type cytochrome [Noviherbaspirillum sp. 1P10PC]|uniref:c-type cytochrome n=1 Tax=Noviherbaspirillum sp. 1P10PC TaxID=3132292 RepID=UPI0039A11A96